MRSWSPAVLAQDRAIHEVAEVVAQISVVDQLHLRLGKRQVVPEAGAANEIPATPMGQARASAFFGFLKSDQEGRVRNLSEGESAT